MAAQDVGLSNLRCQWVGMRHVGHRLDTLLVVPSSLRVLQPEWAVAIVRMELDSLGRLQCAEGALPDSLLLQYRVLPVFYRQSYPVSLLERAARSSHRAVRNPEGKSLWADAWHQGASPFTLKGYVVREAALTQQADAPSVGNMDLTLEGDLGRGVRVQGELLSQNLPFQPDGTTVEVRALDRVYLQVASPRWGVEAGDVDASGRGSFLRYKMPLQGMQYSYRGRMLGDLDTLHIQLSAGLSKGVHTRMHLQPVEGMQGPYRLAGHRGLAQTVVLAGSERVYLNGELLSRGAERDYVIDYNLGEVRFTVRHPIRRRDRIVVEYQMLERHFSRLATMGHVGAQWGRGWRIAAMGYLEHDVVGTMQGTSDREGAISKLSRLPPAEEAAWILPSAPSIDGRVAGGYALRDTLVAGQRHTFFAYTPQGKADSLYEVPFTYVGAGRGEYALTQGEANLPIYQWVGPVGASRGEYRAGQRVRPPQSRRMAELSIGRLWRGGKGETTLAVAYSHMQSNSLLRHAGKRGVAVDIAHREHLIAHGGYMLESGVKGRGASAGFHAVDVFLPTEYYRNWGMPERDAPGEWIEGQLWLHGQDPHGLMRAEVEGVRLSHLRGWRVNLREQHAWYGLASRHRVSYMHMRSGQASHRIASGNWEWSLLRGRWRYAAFGDGEWLLGKRTSNSLQTLLSPYWRSGLRAVLEDSTRYELVAETAFRTDYLADTLRLRAFVRSLESALQGSMRMPHRGSLAGLISWRYSFGEASEQHLLARASYAQPAWRGRLHWLLEQDVGSERTAAWQQHFVRVPYGQGVYVWVDANGDGVAQVEEFARAQFRDEANYVIQVVPAGIGQLALHHRLQASLRFSARANQAPIDSGTVWWQRLDGELVTTTHRKRSDRRYGELFLPFHPQTEPGAVEWLDLVRASLTLNREASPLSFTYSFQRSISSVRFSQGQDRRSGWQHVIGFASPLRYAVQGSLRGELGEEYASYPFRADGQVRIRRHGAEGALRWQREAPWQHEWSAGLRRLALASATRPALLQEYAYTLRGGLGKSWHGAASLRYAHLHSAEGGYSSMLYEATQGMQTGNNIVLDTEIRWQVNHYIELGGEYSLRSLGLGQPVHSASFHVRANFQ